MRALGLDTWHPAVALIAFTPYAAATSVAPVVVALVLRRWGVALVAGAAAVVLAAAVLPRAFAGQPASPDGDGVAVRILSANLYVGAADAGAVMRLVREHDVDVVSLQELTPAALAALDAAGARRLLPDRVAEARAGAAGTAILAREDTLVAPEPDRAPDPRPGAVLEVRGSAPLHVVAVHPYPPLTDERTSEWERALEALPSAGDGRLRVLAGDFNATLDHRALRRVLDRGYVDAADAVGSGLRPTWPAGRRILGIAIDHVLVDRRITVRSYEVHEIPGSDHRAIVAELLVPRPG